MGLLLTIEFIRSEFAKEGYKLLTKVYKNARQKLEYICPRGCKRSITWSNWKQGKRCPCFSKYRNRPTIEFIRAEFAKEGYELLTKVYENNEQKLEYICSRRHKHSITWGSWGQGKRCPCFSKYRNRPTIEFIRSEFAKEGYQLLTKVYKNNLQKLEYICSRGHRHSISWGNWNSKKKYRCPYCKANISKWEKSVKRFVNRLGVGYASNDKTQLLNPKTGRFFELDLWFPQLNKAIECNGLYWHGKKKAIKNDKIKQQLCKNQEIDLLVITDEEWGDDRNNCESKIQKFLCSRQ